MREQSIEFFELVQDNCRCTGKLGLPQLREGCSLASISCRTDFVRDRAEKLEFVPASEADEDIQLPLFKFRKPPVHSLPEKALVQFRMYLQAQGGEDSFVLFTFVAHREDLLGALNLGHGSAESGDISVIPWREWGPDATRWNDANETDTAWRAAVAGQRQILISRDRPRHIRVRDYNRPAVQKMLIASRANSSNQGRCKVVIEESTTSHQGCFQSDIRSSLPYVEVSSAETFDYDGVLMDEEHIIGLTVSIFGIMKEDSLTRA